MTALRIACIAALLCGGAPPASASCDGALARLTSDDGRSFLAERYGVGSYRERTGRGRLTYTLHVWRGRIGNSGRFLHFTEIPGTSGPSSAAKPSEYRAKIAWKASSTFRLPGKLVVYSGPLKGEWSTACDSIAQ